MPPVAEDCVRLLELYRELDRVLQEADWQAMAELDLAIRAHLQFLATQAQLSEQALQGKAHLKRLHDRARLACADECERLRQVLNSHLEHAEGRSAYQLFGS